LTRDVVLCNNDAPVHKSRKGIAAMRGCGHEKFDQPHYSLGWASSDYFLPCNPKEHLDECQFSSCSELKVDISEWFEE
jgi:hypothetical protein